MFMTILLSLCLLCGLIPVLAEEKNVPTHSLVVYFSRAGENYSVGMIEEGNTAKLARIIAKETHSDLFELVPAVPYPESYEETKAIATAEKTNGIYPEYTGSIENWEQYDTVFIGYPIWWGGIPNIVYTFMDAYDFTKKTVIPFNTHEGSGQGGTQSDLENALPGATVLQGLAIRGSKAQHDADGTTRDVQNWLKGLNLQ